MVKVGAKKKRSKKQLEEVKGEEIALKRDRHEYLMTAQKLKQRLGDGTITIEQYDKVISESESRLTQVYQERNNIQSQFNVMH